jgi:hypothetical protein
MTTEAYSSMLNAGIGMIEETRALLDIWDPGMSWTELNQKALQSGIFPNITARRLRNFILEAFKPRYLVNKEGPAKLLKTLQSNLTNSEFDQLLFVYTCRESQVLYDFVCDVYWNMYSSGRDKISNEDALLFVTRANQEGKTVKPWSDSTLQRVARYLTSSCADFGLLEKGQKIVRKILTFRIEPSVAVILAYDLHFSSHGDNSILSHPDWGLFGMDRNDVLNEFKRLALKGWWIIQSAGDVTRIGWQYSSMEELIHAFTQG